MGELQHQQRNRPDGCFALSSRLIDKALGRDFGSRVIQGAIELGLLQSDHHYIPGQKCRWFRFSPLLENLAPEPCEIRGRIAQTFSKFRAHANEQAVAAKQVHSLIWHSLAEVRLSAEAALPIVESIRSNNPVRAAYYDMVLHQITNRVLHFSRDARTGRVFNNFTNLPKPLRRIATVRDAELVEIDISSSQPTFLALLIDHQESERRRYVELLQSGLFYEAVNDQRDHPKPSSDRDGMKRDFFVQVLFGANCPFHPSWRAFEKLFPSLARRITELKAQSHNGLALELQRHEATVIIDRVVPRLASLLPRMPILTIHDAIAVPEQYSRTAEAVLSEELSRYLGFRPRLRVTRR